MFDRENLILFLILFVGMLGCMALQTNGVWDFFDIGAIAAGVSLFGMILCVGIQHKG